MTGGLRPCRAISRERARTTGMVGHPGRVPQTAAGHAGARLAYLFAAQSKAGRGETMGRPNDLFGPETLENAAVAAVPPRPIAASPAPPQGAISGDDGLISVSGLENVALVFLATSGIRDHQAEMIQRRLISVAERSHGKIAVSLSELTSINSAGINALVAVHVRCVELGGHLALFAMSEDVRRVFKITKLDRKMVLAGNAHEAVRSFTKQKKGFLRGLTWAKQERDAA